MIEFSQTFEKSINRLNSLSEDTYYNVYSRFEWPESLPEDVRTQLATILEEVTVERNAAVGQVDADARQAVLDAGSTIIELDATQRQAWVDAMKPVWDQFNGDVGQENIEAAQAINAKH